VRSVRSVQSSHSTTLNARRALTKIDLRIIPILSLMSLFSILDRVNIGNAAVFGISKDLGMKGQQYNVALCIFFVPYVLFEVCYSYSFTCWVT